MNKGFYTIKEQDLVVEWFLLPALSEEYAEKLALLAPLGMACFKEVEMDFLYNYPKAVEEDKALEPFRSLDRSKSEKLMEERLWKMFHFQPRNLNSESKAFMSDVFYYLVLVKREQDKKILGFITFMSGGMISNGDYKITILAVDKDFRNKGVASALMHSLNKIGVKYNKLFASTRPTNDAALHAYQAWGFKISDQDDRHFIKNHWIHLVR